MDTSNGGLSPSERHESAAEIARKKVLAVYSSTLESLKQNQANGQSYSQTYNGNEYIAPPAPTNYGNDFEYAENDYEHVHNVHANQSSAYSGQNVTSSEPSALKDMPINQTNVNEEWKQYHSAWQNYYQNYYSEYYSKAAQNYIATEKLKNERIATGKVQRKRRARKLFPLLIVALVMLGFLFLQYNRMIFAPLMAYVSPNVDNVATGIEAVNPTITQAVSPEPRLIIPKLNIDVPVAFGISTNEVNEAMNHGVAQFMIPGANALPGQIGNLVISGHSAGDIYSSNPYKFIFSGLERLEVGDLIYVNYESVRYTYQMTKSEVVEPTDVAALIYNTNKPMLTLITCTPLGTSRYRLLITAEQISPSYDDAENSGNIDNGLAPPSNTDASMPANEPSFFENIWNGIFGS